MNWFDLDTSFLNKHTAILERIAVKKEQVDAARPLPISVIERLRSDLSLEWTYNSNGIEGNTLTLVETKVVLQEGLTIGGKTLIEHFETINHDKAIQTVEELASPDYKLRALDLLSIHEIVLNQIDHNYAGRLRDVMVRIVGANFTPPSPRKVSDLLEELIHFVNDNSNDLSPLMMATLFHHRFVWIHPFVDGNGRTARLAMNLLLFGHGYPPVIILKNDRKKYYSALNEANKGNLEKLTLMMLQGVERSLNMYTNAIPKRYDYDEYDSLSNLAKEAEVPYGSEYLSLLARKGHINAHKEGRNWVSTKKDVLEYAESQRVEQE